MPTFTHTQDEGGSDSGEDVIPEIGTEGLSAATLALLAGFNLSTKRFAEEEEEGEEEEGEEEEGGEGAGSTQDEEGKGGNRRGTQIKPKKAQKGPTKTFGSADACVAYTAGDVSMIAQTFKRLQAESEASAALHHDVLQNRVLLELLAVELPSVAGTGTGVGTGGRPPAAVAAAAALPETAKLLTRLQSDGMLRINSVLPARLCDDCLIEVNDLLRQATDAGVSMTAETGFGNVLARHSRWDMYMRNENHAGAALDHMLGDPCSQLVTLFAAIFGPPSVLLPVYFHEYSALISDAGAPSQPIHPDTVFSPTCPQYTVFIALQDVEEEMGPTIFLTGTNTEATHAFMKRENPHAKDSFLASCEYRQGRLRKGDCVVMDSRTLHCGSANTSGSRRVLLYFTLRNPLFSLSEADFPSDGSKWADLQLQLGDLLRRK